MVITALGNKKAAERYGVSPRTIGSWKCGDRAPSRPRAMDIAEKENWTLDQVYEGLPTKRSTRRTT